MMIDKITLQQQQQNYSSSSVAGMVTLYNSDHRVVSRIATYVKQVEKLYVVDNSDNPDEQLIQKIKSIVTLFCMR